MSVTLPHFRTISAFLMFIGLLSFALPDALATPPVLTLDAQTRAHSLTRHIEYLEDPAGELTYADLAEEPLQHDFRPAEQPGDINFGYSDSTYWLRFRVNATEQAPREWWLEIAFFSLDDIQLYGPHGLLIHTGNQHPFEQRPIAHRFFVLPLHPDRQTTVYYLRVHSKGSLTLPINLWQPDAFIVKTEEAYSALALYFGAVIALALYNLLLYLALRDRNYLIYVLFAACMACSQLAITGLGNQYLWNEWNQWNRFASDLALSATGIFGLWFVRSFLDTPRNMPRMDWMLRLLLAPYLFNVAYIVIHHLLNGAPRTSLTPEILSINGILAGSFAILAGVIGLQRRSGGARYLLVAWTALLIGTILAAMRNFGWVPSNLLTTYMFQIGSAVEMLLLSFALAERIRAERRAREQAQTDALAARQMMLDVLASNERQLERRIRERTSELATTNEQLRQSEQRLRQAAHTDPLTGLANRLVLDERLEQALEQAGRTGGFVALFLLDLDRFKPVNDHYGHGAGDEVLREVARRLRTQVRAEDTIARIGGDEFVILLGQLPDSAAAFRTADSLVQVLSAPFLVNGRETQVGASIGVAIHPTDARHAKSLYHCADQLMYAAKQAGGGQYRRSSPVAAETGPALPGLLCMQMEGPEP